MDEEKKKYLGHLFNPDHRNSVLEESFSIASEWLEQKDAEKMQSCWKLTKDLYTGCFPGYNACNTEYHDFNHTCDVVNATIRMCDGANFAGKEFLSALQLDIIVAAMLHDAGYIQTVGDTVGTGAKYTKTHVSRGMAFTEQNRERFELTDLQTKRICNIIAGTDLATDFDSIPFADEKENYAGKILATADLLGQMADRTYLEKLLFLYYEFTEAGFPGYETEFDMLRKTLGFYEMTKKRLYNTLENTAELAFIHFSSRYDVRENLYMESIERQIAYLQTIIADDTVNFRKKLKRIDLEAVTRAHQQHKPVPV